mmetsp:Transcript_76419/g.247935  ORF Transcript_76419/g.247935 Transcript_76419/m.247935 type:complete len:90 (+) Transcript_76419:1796-2065(+)
MIEMFSDSDVESTTDSAFEAMFGHRAGFGRQAEGQGHQQEIHEDRSDAKLDECIVQEIVQTEVSVANGTPRSTSSVREEPHRQFDIWRE